VNFPLRDYRGPVAGSLCEARRSLALSPSPRSGITQRTAFHVASTPSVARLAPVFPRRTSIAGSARFSGTGAVLGTGPRCASLPTFDSCPPLPPLLTPVRQLPGCATRERPRPDHPVLGSTTPSQVVPKFRRVPELPEPLPPTQLVLAQTGPSIENTAVSSTRASSMAVLTPSQGCHILSLSFLARSRPPNLESNVRHLRRQSPRPPPLFLGKEEFSPVHSMSSFSFSLVVRSLFPFPIRPCSKFLLVPTLTGSSCLPRPTLPFLSPVSLRFPGWSSITPS